MCGDVCTVCGDVCTVCGDVCSVQYAVCSVHCAVVSLGGLLRFNHQLKTSPNNLHTRCGDKIIYPAIKKEGQGHTGQQFRQAGRPGQGGKASRAGQG